MGALKRGGGLEPPYELWLPISLKRTILDGAVLKIRIRSLSDHGRLELAEASTGSVLNEVADLWDCKFIKKKFQHGFSCEYCEIFKNTYFQEHLQTIASKLTQNGSFLQLPQKDA